MVAFIVVGMLAVIAVTGLFPHLYVFMMSLCGFAMAFGIYIIVKALMMARKQTKSGVPFRLHQRWSKPVFDPKDFEAQMADMFRAYGYHVVETPYQGDHGVDLKVFKDNEFAIVQCKRHANPIGESVVRDFFGALQHEGADHGFIITTSRFTDSAHKWAKGKRIILVDDRALQRMLDETANMRSVGR